MADIYLFSIKKTNKRYEIGIKVDENIYYFKLSEDLLVESRFLSFKNLTDIEYTAFLNKLPLDSLIFEAEKYVNKKQRSSKEVRDKLKEITSSDELIDAAIASLKKRGLINDDYFFETYLDYAINTRKDGKVKISSNLSLYGLTNYSFSYPLDALKKNIRELTIKFDKQSKDIPYDAKIYKAKAFLQSRGYTEQDISTYFNPSLLSKPDEEKLFQKDLRKLKLKYKDDIDKLRDSLRKRGYSENLVRTVKEAEDD